MKSGVDLKGEFDNSEGCFVETGENNKGTDEGVEKLLAELTMADSVKFG